MKWWLGGGGGGGGGLSGGGGGALSAFHQPDDVYSFDSKAVLNWNLDIHYSDVIMDAMASQITNLSIVHLTVYWGTDQRKYQSSTSLARWPVNSPHKWPVKRNMFPFDDVIIFQHD